MTLGDELKKAVEKVRQRVVDALNAKPKSALEIRKAKIIWDEARAKLAAHIRKLEEK